MRRRLGIVALALATVSCGASGSTGASTGAAGAPSQPATAPLAEGSYGSIREIQLDVEASFYLCNAPLKTYDPPTVEGAMAQADCSKAVTLLLFEPNDIQASVAALQAQADDALALLAGDNWIITCSSEVATCEKIQGATGGELITTP